MKRNLYLSATIALVIVLTLALPALADGPGVVAWLKAQQNADGGFGTPESTVGATADVLLAVAATGANAIEWSQDGNNPYTYLKANAESIAGVGDMGKVTLGLIASGVNPRNLGTVDLINKLEEALGNDGQYGTSGMINDQAYAMLALASAKRAVPESAVSYMLSKQTEDGTWSWNGDTTKGTGDNNTAAIAVLALIAGGVPADNEQIQKTLAHLKTQQNEDGGFPYIKPSAYGTDSDANSTAVVMWAIQAAGQDPAGNAWKYEGQDGHSALDKIRAFQNDSGAFRWQDAFADDNFMSTVQAVIALELKTVPFAWMDVGVVAAVPISAPATLPETGANLWVLALALLGSGMTLAGLGKRLRRQ
jgi:prenyltransferase beta subunit